MINDLNEGIERESIFLPNIIYRLRLSPYALAVYAYIKAIASDKINNLKDIDNLSLELGMDDEDFKKGINELSKPFDLLDGKPLLKIKNNDETKSASIEIVDIWRENGEFFRELNGNIEPACF